MAHRTLFYRLTSALLASALALTLTGCGGGSSSASGSDAGVPAAQVASEAADEFILPYSSADGFNPYLSQSNVTLQNSRLLFTSLVDLDNDFNLIYRDAAAVSVSGTAVTITVTGSFADGSAVTGADVAACLNAAKSSAVFGSRFANVQSVRAAGDTVTVTLSAPDSLFAYLLDIPVLKAAEVASPTPSSSGRYSVSSDEKGPCLVANDSFQDKTILPKIRLTELTGYDAMVSSLNIGAISLFSSEQESDLAGSIVCNTAYFNLNNLVFLGIEALPANSVLAQPALRQALSKAVSRRAIADKAYYSRAYVATGVVNPRFPGESAAATLAEESDTDGAKALIESLGYKMDEASGYYQDAAGKRLSFSLLCYSGSSFKRYAAQLVADELKKAGIEITLDEDGDFSSYRSKIASGAAPLYIGEVKLYNNMDLGVFFDDGGDAHTGITVSEPLLTAYNAFKADQNGLAAFETAFAAEMPFVPLVYKNGVATYSKSFAGLSPTVSDIFYQFENLTADFGTKKE